MYETLYAITPKDLKVFAKILIIHGLILPVFFVGSGELVFTVL